MAQPKRLPPGPKRLPPKLSRSLWKLQVPMNFAERAAVTRAAGGRDLAAWSRRVLLSAAKVATEG
jgi:hypothetical protein